MEVDIRIDMLTDCLVDTKTGRVVETEFRERITPMRPADYKGWRFNWGVTEKDGYAIYELFLKDDAVVQGRISLKIEGGVADVEIVEAAPHNYGHNGQYQGVGGHLFAIACQKSLEAGYGGFVAFTSKSNLVEYYKKTLGAKVFRDRRLIIDEKAAQILLEKYLRK